MKKIPYTFSTKSKQIFYFTIMVYFLLRLVVIVEIKLFRLDGYEVYLGPVSYTHLDVYKRQY